MDAETVVRIAQEALVLVMLISAPAVLVALVVGLVVSLFQAATQLQEQTLTIAPKIVAVYVVLLATGLWILREEVRFTLRLWTSIADVGR